jgi:hypothetical protein
MSVSCNVPRARCTFIPSLPRKQAVFHSNRLLLQDNSPSLKPDETPGISGSKRGQNLRTERSFSSGADMLTPGTTESSLTHDFDSRYELSDRLEKSLDHYSVGSREILAD